MKYLRSLVFTAMIAMLAGSLLVGCSSPQQESPAAPVITPITGKATADVHDLALPVYPSRYWEDEFRDSMEKLSLGERRLLRAYMEQHVKTSGSVVQIPVPDGATIGKAIFAQLTIERIGAGPNAELDSLRETIEMKDRELSRLRQEVRSLAPSGTGCPPPQIGHDAHIAPATRTSQNDRSREEALIRFGVPELERQLTISMQKDRQDPRWHEFQTDSPVTASIRAQLIEARRAAEHSTVYGGR